MPLVPDASSGGSGVLSQTSTPATSVLREREIVVRQIGDADAVAERARCACRTFDQPLAVLVLRVGLAGQHDLERMRSARSPAGARDRRTADRGACRPSCAGRTRESGSSGSSSTPVSARTSLDERALRRVRAPARSRASGIRVGAHQQFRLVTPAGHVTVVELAKLPAGPRVGMHAIGDRAHPIARETSGARLRRGAGRRR